MAATETATETATAMAADGRGPRFRGSGSGSGSGRGARPGRLAVAAGALALGWALAPLGSGTGSARAQAERYELGLRVRAFERDWDAASDEARRRTTASLREAVRLFFAFRLADAGKALDEGRFLLRSPEGGSSAERWAFSRQLTLESRFLDAGSKGPRGRISAFHSATAEPPSGAAFRVRLLGRSGETLAEAGGPLGASAVEVALPAPASGVPEGDLRIAFEVFEGDAKLAETIQGISFAERLDARLASLRERSTALEDRPRSTDRESLRLLIDLLETLAKGRTLETDYPAASILREAEELAAAVEAGEPYHGKNRTGQHWLTLAPEGGRAATARVAIPESARAGEPLPLVIALHGAGGSENLFFDGYGDGAIVKACASRGWLLVATRSGFGTPPLPAVIDEMARLYPVDRARVAVVGHSMGAGQALAAAVDTPDRFAAVVALGGGRAIRDPAKVAALPFFVGVGREDFAFQGARGLAESLRRGGVARVEYREYPDIEHLAIVQAAMGDLMRFLDGLFNKADARPNPSP